MVDDRGRTHQTSLSCYGSSFKDKSRWCISSLLSNPLWFFVDILSFKLEGFEEFYRRYIGWEYIKEYDLGFYPKEGRVIHIGCGFYPLSIIMLAGLSDSLSIVGIDNNESAVRHAADVIRRYNLEERVSIKNGDGCRYPMGGFDVVIVSSCANPKLSIIGHVLDDVKKGAIVFIRELNYNYASTLSYINSRSDVRIVGILGHNPLFFVGVLGWRSICVEKL